MKNFFGLALFLGASFGISSFSAFAQDSDPQNDRPGGQQRIGRKNGTGKMRAAAGADRRGGMMRELENLNLSDAQKQQLQNLRRSNQFGAASRAEVDS